MFDPNPTPPPLPPSYQTPPPPPSAFAGSENATTILVLGILGVLCCTPLGVGALVMSQKVRKEAELTGQQVDGKVTAGFILGIISSIFLVLGLLYLLLIVGLGVAGS